MGELETAIEALTDRRVVFDAAEVAGAGAFVSIAPDGSLGSSAASSVRRTNCRSSLSRRQRSRQRSTRRRPSLKTAATKRLTSQPPPSRRKTKVFARSPIGC